MAVAGQVIENPATGERITFLEVAADTAGERLVLETIWPRPGHRATAHIHPALSERFEVLGGRARFLIDGDESELGPGESVTVPPGVLHLAWNPTDAPVRLRLTLTPALRWEHFVERLFSGEDPRELLRAFSDEIALPPAP